MTKLNEKKCIPCEGGVPPLSLEKRKDFLKELNIKWKIESNHHLEREFSFKDFAEALDFTNRVGELAENEGHHPDIFLSWGKVKVQIVTHKIDALTESDFILAAKIDDL